MPYFPKFQSLGCVQNDGFPGVICLPCYFRCNRVFLFSNDDSAQYSHMTRTVVGQAES